MEKEFDYQSDEESIFGSFHMDHNQKLPLIITKKFALAHESSANKNQVKAVIKRFNEYT